MAETGETSRLVTVRGQWAVRSRAAKRPHFKIVHGKVVPYKVSPPAELDVVITADVAEEKATLEIGQKAANGTIYLGRYAPKDRDGNSLGKIFNVFAAPQDLTDDAGKKTTFRYVDAIKRIAELKEWNGFDGTNYANDKEIYQALKDGSYNGCWIIPTRELLAGTAADDPPGARQGTIIQPDNLLDHQNKGAFRGTFTTAFISSTDFPDRYWSSTEDRNDQINVWDVHFPSGKIGWAAKDGRQVSCRPVRLVAAP